LIPKTVVQMVRALNDKKAVDIQLLDMREIVYYTDYLLICTATSSTHADALADNVEEGVQDDLKLLYRNPSKDNSWLILDFGDVILHVFSGSARLFYDLEQLWGDAKRVDLSKIISD